MAAALRPLVRALTTLLGPLRSASGNLLAYVVLVMVIFGLLGALMVSLFSTSLAGSAEANARRRAVYLAESGLRYGMSELRNAGFSSAAINRLNTTTHRLPPAGEFRVNAFSPWFESAANQSIEPSGTVRLNVAKGRVPEGFLGRIPVTAPLLRLVNFDFIDLNDTGIPETARTSISGAALIDDNTLDFQANDDFIVGKGETICFSVHPFAAGQTLMTMGNFDLQPVAKNIFPLRDGAFRFRKCDFYYRSAEDLGDRFRLYNLSSTQIPCIGIPFTNIPADEEIIFSPRNYLLTSRGTSGEVSYGGDLDHAIGVTSHAGLAPNDRGADISFDEETDLAGVLQQVKRTESDRFVTVDNEQRAIILGGESGPALGGVWFRDTRNIGGVREYCNAQGCFFNRGIRVFFTLQYSGTGDGLVFALVNGNPDKNDTASIGGDIAQSELLGFSGDSRLDPAGTIFLDNSGPARGLLPPKIGLEFDTRVNYNAALEQSLRYCEGASLNADTRNDPGSSGKDAVQYVFWGNSALNVPCRREPYCGGSSSCRGDPSYDDNRHNATGDGTQNWAYLTGGNIESSPAAAADGTIYFGSGDGHLYALNPNGALRWRLATGGRVYSPTVAGGGTIYVGSEDGNLYAVHPEGYELWRYPTGGPVRTRPAVSATGNIYFGSDDGYFYALTPGGSLLWRYNDGAPIRSSPAFSPSGGTVYFGSDSGVFYALTASSGTLIGLTAPAPINAFVSSPAVGPDGRVYVGNDNGRIYAFNSAASGVVWSVATGEAVRSSPAVGTNGVVYVGSMNDRLYAIEAATGAVRWTYPAGGNIQSPVALNADNHVYFGSDDNRVHALYADGSVKWTFETSGDVRGKPLVLPDGTVYAGSFDNRLYAINQFANPKNYRDRQITYDSGRVGGAPAVVDDANDWLKGASSRGPWAVRMEITRSRFASGGTYAYTLKTWLRQCATAACSGENEPLSSFFADTRVEYSPSTRPAQLEQTINLLSADHADFERVIFGFVSQTGAGDLQTATIRNFRLSFIRPDDPKISSDPTWP
ncbi:MAG: PQQ-binding-like beta-propeller repeat protein [Desulfobacterales bacterium]